MELKKVEKIVNDYGKVLGIASQMFFGAPESLLPYPKKIIQNTIKLYLLALSKLNKLDEEFQNHLMMGYAHLADFIPDEEAKVGLRVQAYVEKYKKHKRKNMNDPKKLAKVASNFNLSDWNKVIKVTKEINREFNQNLAEIEKFTSGIK